MITHHKLEDRASQMAMNVRREKPPIYDLVCEKIGTPPDDVLFCYGREIYIPGSAELSPGLAVHEAVHSFQQEGDVEGWWGRYCLEPEFRFAQELEAHRWEYQFYKKMLPRHMAQLTLEPLAKRLSSETYGNVVNTYTAKQLIRRKPNASRGY